MSINYYYLNVQYFYIQFAKLWASMRFSCFFSYVGRWLFSGKRRNKKKKMKAKQSDETAKTEDSEMESKQDVESGAEEPAAEAEAPVVEDEGRNTTSSSLCLWSSQLLWLDFC